VTARALRQRARTSDWMVRAGLYGEDHDKTKHTESREDRELSVQDLETVTGGAKRQENQEQTDAARIFAQALQGAAQV